MDPNANIARQRALAEVILSYQYTRRVPDNAFETLQQDAEELAELVLALDEWRRRGGFDPYDNVRRSVENV